MNRCKLLVRILTLTFISTVILSSFTPVKADTTSTVSYLVINTATEQVVAYDVHNNPIQVFACSTGVRGNTTVGTYRTSDYYEWRNMLGGVWARYAVRFNGGELLHSVPYYHKTKNSLEYKQYNRLGVPASAGCCRLALIDAKWIYDNTVPGTVVQVIHNENLVYELTRDIIKVDETDVARRGWDPTDWDPDSPYNKTYGDL